MKNTAIKILAVLLVIAGISALGFLGYSLANIMIVEATGNQARAEIVGDAPQDAFEGFESFVAGDGAYELGVNTYGKTIFADNTAAFKATKEKCARAIQEMRSQAPELRRFKQGSIDIYSNYIWQINWDDVDQKVLLQKQFLVRFMEYYENGDPHQDSY